MVTFLSGALFFGFFVAGLLFCKFWRRTRDSFFLMFGMAFFLMAAERVVLALRPGPAVYEERTFVYLFRLAAFGLILAAIVQKNRSERR